ncbi:serine/threonine kinase [Pseudanabaena sp. lw0831]|uniref:protein kinase domain-containing protein n=1 Tax=Pseudanabaena sp. lw0831 TaxID=1357935 RepID=UPI00191599A4|nr:protein kinase [Pseudanabaena sp. lw0831]GBO55028.1 serine/threonine kinase [Pseudanabaena sp. lw0831]
MTPLILGFYVLTALAVAIFIAEMESSMIGQLLDGRYRIASKLGEGGFGHTYLAHDTRIPNEPLCIVKHLKPASSDREYLKVANRLFTSEAQTLAQLGHHDRIPRLLAYFEEAGEFYLVEEFVEGRSLELELVRGYRLSETQVFQILDDLLSIVEYTHSHGVIHRDIKPDNIIRRRSDGKLVLIDFGAIKQVQTQLNQEGQTAATVAIGTLGYMPSEQAQGKPRPNSDLYAIGVIGIQALTGLPPRELQEDYQTGELIWQHLVPNKSGLVDVLAKMTRYHYKDRYESAAEIRKLLTTLSDRQLPNQPVSNAANGLQSTIVSVNNNSDLGTELLSNSPPTIPPTEVYKPIQPWQVPNSPIHTVPVNRHPAPEPLSSQTVQAYAPQPNSNDGSNHSNKGLWIAVWGGAFATAISIGVAIATQKPNPQPIVEKTTPNSSSNNAAITPSPSPTDVASPQAIEPTATASPTPSPTAKASASPTPKASPKVPIEPLSEADAVAIVNNLVASKNQMFAPPFDRQLLAELTTGEAYEKRKGSIDWLQSNNAFYSYGEFTVSRAGSFGIQDNQANITVEIFESPTLYVNGKIDRTQSQPSRGRYICTLIFENSKWKIANLTKVN